MVICAGCYYLIADKGWNESKDNKSWPDADYEEVITLGNSNAGVALSANGNIIDAVGWGNPPIESLFEGTPANNPDPGNALMRKTDTNNNSNDFEEKAPFFRSSSDIGTGTDTAEVGVAFDISNSSNESAGDIGLSIDFANLSNGRKVSPVPGGTAYMTVNAQVTGQEIDNVTATLEGNTAVLAKAKEENSTTSLFSGKLSLEHYMPPGKYYINIEASAGKSKESIELSLDYLELVAIEAEAGIDFGEISIGKDYFSEIKVRNTGNVVVDIGIRSPGFSSGSEEIGAGSVYFSIGGSAFSRISSSTVIRDTNLQPGSNSEAAIQLRLSAPEDAKSGEYTGSIGIIAVGSEN
jgi:hypothetical protein